MGKKQFHTRLDDDTAQWVDEFKEERDITQAEAVRRLVRAGQQEYQRDDSDDGRRRVPEQDDDDDLPDNVVRHGVAPSFSFVIRVAILFLAIFAGGSAWEAGTAFGDFLTVVGVF
jgi:hypothetical protein